MGGLEERKSKKGKDKGKNKPTNKQLKKNKTNKQQQNSVKEINRER
jgi:hypothetical protein